MSEVMALSRSRRKQKGLKSRLVSKAMEGYEMPDLSLPDIQARGNREFTVDGCKGILEYEQDSIKLNTGKLIITFLGDAMEISVYSELETIITGNIFSVEFSGNTEVKGVNN